MVSIETYWNLRIVIDPYSLKIGYNDPKVQANLVLISHEHSDHNNDKLVKGAIKVIHAIGNDGKVRKHHLILDRRPNQPKATITSATNSPKPTKHAVRVRTIPSFHDNQDGAQRGNNGLWIIDVDGVRIVHCGDLGQPVLTKEQMKGIGKVDVLLIPVGGVYTIDGKQAAELVKQIKPRIAIPIHYKTNALKFDLQNVDPFLNSLPKSYQVVHAKGNTLPASKGRGPSKDKPQVVVLKHEPLAMAKELSQLFEAMESGIAKSKTVYEPLSAKQMNHKPSNGTHTPRWNVEHTVGRHLGFFSQIYSKVDTSIPHIDINPKQMPKDYLPAEPTWTGAEENHRIDRAHAFVLRYAYLLDGLPLDKKAPGSFWTVRGLCKQMQDHFWHHTANVLEKMKLPDWPKE